MEKKSGLAQMIIAKMSKSPDESETPSTSDLGMILKDLSDAMKAEDWEAAAEAFKSACEAADSEEDKEDPAEESSEKEV